MKKQLLLIFFVITHALAAEDPLPSWNEGEAKSAIIDFVNEVKKIGGDNYIPPKDRIATFDEDGTMWVEKPVYTEFFYAMAAIKAMADAHPDWKTEEPFKSILADNIETMKNFNEQEIVMLIAATHSGMTVDEFHHKVADWLKTARHPRFKRPFTDLVYQPMMEVMNYLRANQFQIYIVSGGGQEFMRSFAEQLYELPPSHIIGTAGQIKYEYRHGKPVLFKVPKLLFINNFAGKPEGINLIIGKKPVIAFGNSTGDQQMLEWTQSRKGKTLELLVHHDDADREYAYGPDSKIGTFSDALMADAKQKGWIVISMKNDWNTIFLWQK